MNTNRQASVSTAFSSSPKLSRVFGIQRKCFLFPLENTATRKQLVYFDHQKVNSLCSRHQQLVLVPCFKLQLARTFSLGYFLKTYNHCLYYTTHSPCFISSNMFSNMFSGELSLPCRQYRLGICERTLWSLLIALLHPYSEQQQERAGEPVQGLHVVPLNLRPEIKMKSSRKYSIPHVTDR